MLLILFVFVPLIEIYLLFKIGAVIGGLNTILVMVVTGMFGAFLVKKEGRSIIFKVSKTLSDRIEPSKVILQGLSIFIGGLLLITPGFLTDAMGFSLIIPYTRALYINYFKNYFLKKIQRQEVKFYSSGSFSKRVNTEDNVVDTKGVRVKSK